MFGVVDVRTIAMLSGPLVGAGYFLGSIQWRILHRRWQLRSLEPIADEAFTEAPASGREGEGFVAAFEALIPLVYALVVWSFIESVAPGGGSGFNASSFIGALSNEAPAADRLGGSVALAFRAAQLGAQMVRVHDVQESVQALHLWRGLADAGLSAV